MEIIRQLILYKKIKIPNVAIIPDNPLGCVIIIHGYGGCKEEQLGLAWRIAELGILAFSIDLRGHGEHSLPLDDDVSTELEAVIEYGKQHGKVTTIGHSLGGRLALLSKSDYAIAISPALNREFTVTTQKILQNIRSYRVVEDSPNKVFEIIKKLPIWHPSPEQKSLILYGTRDVPEIIEDCRELKNNGVNVREIRQALHSDTFLVETTFKQINDQLKKWYF